MQRNSKSTQLSAFTVLGVRILLLSALLIAGFKVSEKWINLDPIPSPNVPLLLIALGLMPLNVWIEWRRFLWSLPEGNSMPHERLSRFCQGLVLSFFTPQLFSSTFGRMRSLSYLENKHYLQSGIQLGISQFIVTLCFALIGAISVLKEGFFATILLFTIALLAAMMLLIGLTKPSTWMIKIPLIGKVLQTQRTDFVWQLYALALFRYMVFSLQFHLLLMSFGVSFTVLQPFVLMLSYGFIALSPSLLFGKIVIREAIALSVFSLFGFAKSIVLYTAFLTWGMNVFIPVVCSIVILMKPWKYTVS